MLHVAFGHTGLDTSYGLVLLTLGGALGVLTVPLYFMGYGACRSLFAADGFRANRPLLVFSALVAVFGAFTHGWTAFDIFNALSSGTAIRRPEDAFVASAPLAVAAAVAAIACLGATLTLLIEARRKDWRLFKQLIWANPVSGTIALNVLALLGGDMGQYVAPAAPNLAHALFFAACAYHLGSTQA